MRPGLRRRPPLLAPRRCSRPRPGTSGPHNRRTLSRPPGTPGAAPRPAAPATAGTGRGTCCTGSRRDGPRGTPATEAEVSRPCAAPQLPVHPLPVRLGTGNPRRAEAGGTAPPPKRRHPAPPATATRVRPPSPGPRNRSPYCWRCPARRRSRGGCARVRTSGASVLESCAWTTSSVTPSPSSSQGPRREGKKGPLQQVLQRRYSLTPG